MVAAFNKSAMDTKCVNNLNSIFMTEFADDHYIKYWIAKINEIIGIAGEVSNEKVGPCC